MNNMQSCVCSRPLQPWKFCRWKFCRVWEKEKNVYSSHQHSDGKQTRVIRKSACRATVWFYIGTLRFCSLALPLLMRRECETLQQPAWFHCLWSLGPGWHSAIHGGEWISMCHANMSGGGGASTSTPAHPNQPSKPLQHSPFFSPFFCLSAIKVRFVKICDIIWSSFLDPVMSRKVSKDEALPSWKPRRGDKFTLTELIWKNSDFSEYLQIFDNKSYSDEYILDWMHVHIVHAQYPEKGIKMYQERCDLSWTSHLWTSWINRSLPA